jgi:recombinational DNA repair ATPase RecF
MRIHSVTLDADRLLIHGLNEIGKSSLIEAIHRCSSSRIAPMPPSCKSRCSHGQVVTPR